jgi:hypothetical protein
VGCLGHLDGDPAASVGLPVGQYPADRQRAHRRPVRCPSWGCGRLAAAAESLNRRGCRRAKASHGRLMDGQVRQEGARITTAISLGQVTGYQQCQGRVVGRGTARPSLAGRQLLDLGGGYVDIRLGCVFPRQTERVTAGVSGQCAGDALAKVVDLLRVYQAQQPVTHGQH